MSSDMLNIAASGLSAAQASLDLTSQNIANASTPGYVRRSLDLGEVVSGNSTGQAVDISYSGVRILGVRRNVDQFRQAEARRTGSDAASASAQLTGLQDTQSALEGADVFTAMTNFEAGIRGLAAKPTDPALRAGVLGNASALSASLNIAAKSLDQVAASQQFDANAGVVQVNQAASQLAQINLQLTRAGTGTADQSQLLDQRDTLLKTLSNLTDVTATINPDQTVTVQTGGTSGPVLVSGGTASPLAMATAADGTISFTLGGAAMAPASGSLAGEAQALSDLKGNRAALDSIASSLIATVNAQQTAGVALDGTAGQPLFSGADAKSISVALTSGAQLATAPAGAAAQSQDPANLVALQTALAGADVSGQINTLMFNVSNAVAGQKTTTDALQTVAGAAQTTLDASAGVNLDDEAVNLVRFQRAYQASSRAIQVATDTFNSLLAIH